MLESLACVQVCEIIRHVLAAHGTCEKQLGLSVFVQLRASEWVARQNLLRSSSSRFKVSQWNRLPMVCLKIPGMPVLSFNAQGQM